MYIEPFWCGVIATILVEILIGILSNIFSKKEDGK